MRAPEPAAEAEQRAERERPTGFGHARQDRRCFCNWAETGLPASLAERDVAAVALLLEAEAPTAIMARPST